MANPQDDLFHQRSDDPYWNESGWFSFIIPERKLLGWVWLYHRPNMNMSAGSVAMWDPTGDHIYDCLYYQYDEHRALPEGAEMFNCTLDNGLTVETLELQKSYRMSYKGYGCELDLTWESIMDPQMANPVKQEAADLLADWCAAGHYDQGGRVQGTVTVAGETLEVDHLALRDHSWGPRRPRSRWPRANYYWAFASERSGFYIWSMSGTSPDDKDPVFGTTEAVMEGLGWYMRDGILGELTSGETRVERGDDGRPVRMVVDAKDQLGRDLHAEGRAESWLRWHGAVTGDLFMWWTLVSWEFDGQQGWGENQDYMMLQNYRRLVRSLRTP